MSIIRAFQRSTGPSAMRSFARAFARRKDGSVSIEMGFATIVFVTLLTGLIGFGSVFFVQGSMADAARDTVRRVATGQMTTAEAQTYAQGHLINWGMTYTVTATNDGTDATVQISVPMSQAALIDFLGLFTGNLAASVTMPVES
jgi:Flp pilus assembly protein TadG